MVVYVENDVGEKIVIKGEKRKYEENALHKLNINSC